MKYVALAYEPKHGEQLVKDITKAGGQIIKQSDVMPEIIVFDGKGGAEDFWLKDFSSAVLKHLQKDHKVTVSDTDPIEKPIKEPFSTANANEYPGWHLDAINRGTIAEGIKQEPAHVYIADTGISNHSDLPPFDTIYTNFDTEKDYHGHGTHVAGLAVSTNYGVNKSSDLIKLHSVKVLDDEGSGSMSGITEGLLSILEHHLSHDRPSVVNMSLAARGQISSMSSLAVLERMMDEGILVVVAAGNRGESLDHHGEFPNWREGIDTFPAEVPGTLCVSAARVDALGEFGLATFSNYGGNSRINAPGQKVTSTYLGGNYATMSGTSMASPIAAGLLALRMTAESERPKNRADVDKIMEQFITAFSEPTLNVAETKMHTNKMLDMSFINMPELWGGDEKVEEPQEPRPEPEKPKEKGSKKKYVIAACILVVLTGLVVLV